MNARSNTHRYRLFMNFDKLTKILRSQWDEASASWIESVFRTDLEFDWDKLLETARQARISPLLHLVLHNREWVPDPVRRSLRLDLMNVARQNLIALDRLAVVLQAFNDAEIPHILLKGTALVVTLYKNEGLRPMCDVDVLLHHEDVPRACEILRQLGYNDQNYNLEERPGVNLSYENELIFIPDDADSTPIEVHWGFFNALHYARTIQQDWLWETALPAQANTIPSLVLGPEASLLHLCGHLLLHHSGALNNSDLLWLHDIALLLVRCQADIKWDILLSHAVNWNLITPLQIILPKMVRDWKAPVPENVMRQLSGFKPTANEKRVVRWLTSTDKQHTGWNVWMNARALPTFPQRVKYIMTQLFPSVHYMRERYGMFHPLLLPFYYIYRLLRGISTGL
jgi:hypothetical protein